MTTTEGTTTAPAAGTLAADPAFAQFDAETQGAFKNKGWDQKTPAEAAREALKSFTEAERFVGIPKDQIIRMPKDAADKAGWDALRARLGVPADAKGYDFASVKRADGSALDDKITGALAPALLAAGVAKDNAGEVAKAFVKFLDDAETSGSADKMAKLAIERDGLAKDWGGNMEANKFIARQAAMKLGLTEEQVGALEGAAGYKSTMGMLLRLGQMMGEDKFVADPNSRTPGVLTGGQAAAKLKELRADSDWVRKVNNGDLDANREHDALTRLVAMAGQ